MAESIKFDRKPYNVTYYQGGVKKVIRRMPPPKLHEALPTDEVRLTRKYSDDFDSGDKLTVKNVNPRHPNTLQVIDDDGKTTFISYRDMELTKKVLKERPGEPQVESYDNPISNEYLLWP